MDTLPNDIIDIIYMNKHKLEWKDIMSEVIEFKEDDIFQLNCLYNYFVHHNYCLYNPLNFLEICVALKNESCITYEEFHEMIIRMDSIFDFESIQFDETISCNYILEKFSDYLDDALRLHDLANE